MTYHGIDISSKTVERFCRSYHVRKLALFGSVLRDDFGPDSDIDVLVEFEPGHTMSLLGMARLEMELTKQLGRQVDLRTPAELSRYFRDDVLNHCEVQYVQK
ncbi:nucleotidyltransferase family protein [candidate division FCPU426 bacterium]|nr:nucleotidyltransferase family protein [candidate division FCPU426 bacterium]